MFQRIVIATDGSDPSMHAAQLAVELARTHSAALLVVYVVEPYPFLGLGDISPDGFVAYTAAAKQVAEQALAQVAALCQDGGKPVALQTRLLEGNTPAHAIVQCAQAEGADLVVLGTHGRNAIERLLLGSVAARVVAQATMPVLVTR